MSSSSNASFRLPVFRWWWAGLTPVVFFAVMVGRCYHPLYRFTAFLELDPASENLKISAFRERPIFVHPKSGGYDGQYYAQIAYDPSLRSPELPPAMDNLAYRARRILAPALSWVLAGGNPDWIVHIYSVFNILCWLVLAVVAWRLFNVVDLHSWIGWAGLMFSAGALHSVRLALSDLAALTVVAGAILAFENRRQKLACGFLAISGLARETALLALPGFLAQPWFARQSLLKNACISLGVFAPLALWIFYIHLHLPAEGANPFVFTWPGFGYVQKWRETLAFVSHSKNTLLAAGTLLALISLTVQASYFLLRPRRQDRWWLAGMPYIVLMLLLGQAVWEDNPGAITRVLLPLQLFFNLLTVRHRAPLLILIAGNLSVLSGLTAFRESTFDPRELGWGRIQNIAVIAKSAEGWYDNERGWHQVRTWSQNRSQLQIEAWPRTADLTVALSFETRGIGDGLLTIRQDGKVLWEGTISAAKEACVIPWISIRQGRAMLTCTYAPLNPDATPQSGADARSLAFAIYNLSITGASGAP